MRKTWSILDFILIVVGGIIGVMVAVAVGVVIEDDDLFVVLGLAGQNVGHLVTFWLLSRTKEDPDVGFDIQPTDPLYIGAGLALQFGLVLLFFPLAERLFPDGGSAQEISDTLLGLDNQATRVGAALILVVLAPVTEEIMFRGVLMKTFKTSRKWIPIVVTALVFSAFHLAGLSPDRYLEAVAIVIPQLFIAGIVLAWLTLRTGRLGPAIFTHSGFNLLAAIALLLPSDYLDSLLEGIIGLS